MCPERASASGTEGPNAAVAGSQTSSEAGDATLPQPPMTRTRPSGRSVALCIMRPSASEPAGLKDPVAGDGSPVGPDGDGRSQGGGECHGDDDETPHPNFTLVRRFLHPRAPVSGSRAGRTPYPSSAGSHSQVSTMESQRSSGGSSPEQEMA